MIQKRLTLDFYEEGHEEIKVAHADYATRIHTALRYSISGTPAKAARSAAIYIPLYPDFVAGTFSSLRQLLVHSKPMCRSE